MTKVLDITPLRSLIAVADAGGFHRAAAGLSLSQSAVSQHIRRLERVLGRPLVEPDGRRARLTPSGVALLAEARQIVAAHDEVLRRLALDEAPAFVIGTTDHSADHLLPPVIAAMEDSFPDLQVRFRFDRTTPLNDSLTEVGSNGVVPSVVSAVQRDSSINYVLSADGAFITGTDLLVDGGVVGAIRTGTIDLAKALAGR